MKDRKLNDLHKAERRRQRDAELEELAKVAQETEGDHSWYPDEVAAIQNRYKDLEDSQDSLAALLQYKEWAELQLDADQEAIQKLEEELCDARDAIKLVSVLKDHPVVTRVWSGVEESDVDVWIARVKELKAAVK